MSDTKFTPGPWMFKAHDGTGRVFEMKRVWEVGGGPDKAGVAFVFKGEANARLIAAAPDLYMELKACIQNLTMAMLVMDAEARAVCMACIQAHKAVLAKAEATQ
jgi:hypothetical protein